MIPQSAIAAGVERLDLGALMQEIRKVAGQLSDSDHADFDRGLAEAKQVIGFDLEQDLLSRLRR